MSAEGPESLAESKLVASIEVVPSGSVETLKEELATKPLVPQLIQPEGSRTTTTGLPMVPSPEIQPEVLMEGVALPVYRQQISRRAIPISLYRS